MSRVLVGMSGGVDSAVAAYLLKKEGYDVVGVTLRTWQSDDGGESRCCEIDDARRSADLIGIDYHTLNCTMQFKEKVIDPFIDEYINARTPNPCIECNRYVKWERMLYMAKVLEADYIATGHYARIKKLDNGRYTVQKALHAKKDQTYMLYKLTQEQLAATLMPLGDYTKDEVRQIATDIGLSVAQKKDSQEICFVTNDDHADFISNHTDKAIPEEGNFVDEEGNILGRHKGLIRYTVGQRKGLNIALGYPAYINKIDPVKNEVVLGPETSVMSTEVFCRDVNFLSISNLSDNTELRCYTKIRYHHEAKPSVISRTKNELVKIIFDEPVKAAAPGQSAVFYDENDCVIGGGIITTDHS